MLSITKYNLCRLCLCRGGSLVDICEENGHYDFVVEDAIQDLLRFRVVKENGLPWNACRNCLEKLADFRLFKRRCIECKITFESRVYGEHQWLGKSPHEFKEESEDDILVGSGAADHREAAGIDANGAEHCNGPGEDKGDWTISIVKEEEIAPDEMTEEHLGDEERGANEVLVPETEGELKQEVTSCHNDTDSARTVKHIGWLVCGIMDRKTAKDIRERDSTLTIIPDATIPIASERLKSEESGDNLDCALRDPSGASFDGGMGIVHAVPSTSSNPYQFCPPQAPDSTAGDARAEVGADRECGILRCAVEENAQGTMFSTELFGDILEDDKVKPNNDETFHAESPVRSSEEEYEEPTEKPTGIDATDSRTFQCPTCAKSFGRGFTLNRHLKYIHGIDPVEMRRKEAKESAGAMVGSVPGEKKDFACGECGKKFLNNRRLRRHVVIHRADKNSHECEICHKMLSRRWNLLFHLKTVHLKEKDFVCDLCGIKFSHKGHYNTHMLIHKGQKPHMCPICRWRFSSRTDLRKHQVVHARRFRNTKVDS